MAGGVGEKEKNLTTFITHRGLYRFRVMPFGLVNAPATFCRIMRKLLQGLTSLDNYLDDVLCHTKDWKEHLSALKQFFERVRKANLVLRPSKCEIGRSWKDFLGHRVGENKLEPNSDLVSKIISAGRPLTRKQLQSFLDLVGYYRRFIPNFAAIAVPLTDMIRKGTPNKLEWGLAQDNAFGTLKYFVAHPPILQLPDFSRGFVLQTDACNEGIGAVLLQENDEGFKHPVAFISRKLLPREVRYATIEKECLAIVWGITKFQEFLYGQHFILETDHQPLQYLGKSQYQNGRLMRWALSLQPYRFTIRAIRGKDNIGADYLSRSVCT